MSDGERGGGERERERVSEGMSRSEKVVTELTEVRKVEAECNILYVIIVHVEL